MLRSASSQAFATTSRGFLTLGAGALMLLTAAQLGCGRPFNVKTQVNQPATNYAAKATVESVSVEAQAVTDENYLYDTFDANLISAGILPVRVKITNSGGEAVGLSNARFDIEARGQRFKSIDARKAFKRLISYYEISAYTKAGYAESRESLAAFALDLALPLEGGQSREGLVFFLTPSATARQTGFTMNIAMLKSKQTAGVSLKLN